MLSGKKVLLAVTGSIAAYKTTFLTRLLIKAGAEVKVILSPAARDFVSPLTLATLSKNPVLWEYFDPQDEEGKWNNHVDLALWADLMIVAPVTANTLSRMASGASENLLLGTYLSAKCPVYFAPAMDLDMYKHPSTKTNINKLQDFGNHFIPSQSGELASGLAGEGRMAEPEDIVDFIEAHLKQGLPLQGKKVLINAGPTHEAIDPVRFIGNHSTGKMGVALAEVAYEMGAHVHLVLGPGSVRPSEPNIHVKDVTSAREMNEACLEEFSTAELTILSAAIADYRPESTADKKIKKSGEGLTIKLVENPDVLYGLGKLKTNQQTLVGFALETNNGVENAIKKLHKKNCDLIVLNSPSDKGSGFGHNTNEVTLIDRKENQTQLGLKPKREIAKEIIEYVVKEFFN
jgi:phosphopantothenoylcysteine decarboxylase/phosphopantothenate--cysteine ligase